MTKRLTAMLACAGLALVSALTVAPAFAAPQPQDVTITITPPVTGGAPAGYRAYRDGTAIGAPCLAPSTGLCAVSGQPIVSGFPDNVGTYVLGVEAFNATGTGPRLNNTVTMTPPVPGAIPKITITVPCATTLPPTCTVVVN